MFVNSMHGDLPRTTVKACSRHVGVKEWTFQFNTFVWTMKHMWQSRVEIEHYSVPYFDRITKFKTL